MLLFVLLRLKTRAPGIASAGGYSYFAGVMDDEHWNKKLVAELRKREVGEFCIDGGTCHMDKIVLL